jgi:hypothetical protein
MNNFYFYNCCMEWQQEHQGEKGYLAGSEVLQTVCDVDFQENGSYLHNPKTDYYHKYAKQPKDGMYLMRVARPAAQTIIHVFIDTRLFPNFIWIEKIDGRLEECLEVGRVVESSLSLVASKHGWKAKFVESQLNEVHHPELFLTAWAYINNVEIPIPGFANCTGGSAYQFMKTQNNYYYGYENQGKAEKPYPEEESDNEEEIVLCPSVSKMCEACEKTLEEGLWWGDASWGIAYQVFRQKGYTGGIDQFVEDVRGWPWKKPFPKKCNKYSVGDPARRGAITWPLGKWEEKGANKREIKLGERIMEILES